MITSIKIARGILLVFVLSAGCIGDKTPGNDKIISVQEKTAPETTGVTPSTTAGFSLTSQVFQDSGFIPAKYTCDGKDISPPLSLAVPDGTKSLALIMDDPDAPGGIFSHWVLFNLPGSVRSLPEGVSKVDIPDIGGVQGMNDFDEKGYNGPCPPSGKPHTYRFILYALDAELNLRPGAAREEVLEAMQGHVLNKAELDGKYGR